MQRECIKRGESIVWTVVATDDNDQPIIGLEEHMKAQIRTMVGAQHVADVLISTTGEPGTYLFDGGDTELWTPGVSLVMDVRYENGAVVYSETVLIYVERSVTRNEPIV